MMSKWVSQVEDRDNIPQRDKGSRRPEQIKKVV